MGTYYRLVNSTKREQYEPANGAVKHGNFIWYAEEIAELLLGRWLGDPVRMVSDSGVLDLYMEESDTWPNVAPIYNARSELSLDHNGMTKLLEAFIRAFGCAAVAVALDEALEKVGTEIK